jgi:hypothetical protein
LLVVSLGAAGGFSAEVLSAGFTGLCTVVLTAWLKHQRAKSNDRDNMIKELVDGHRTDLGVEREAAKEDRHANRQVLQSLQTSIERNTRAIDTLTGVISPVTQAVSTDTRRSYQAPDGGVQVPNRSRVEVFKADGGGWYGQSSYGRSGA